MTNLIHALTGGQVAECRPLKTSSTACQPTGSFTPTSSTTRTPSAGRSKLFFGGMPNIPPKSNRRWKSCFSPFLYRDHNTIQRMFDRLKDFRRIAT